MDKEEVAKRMNEPFSKNVKRFSRELKHWKERPLINPSATGKSIKRHIKIEHLAF